MEGVGWWWLYSVHCIPFHELVLCNLTDAQDTKTFLFQWFRWFLLMRGVILPFCWVVVKRLLISRQGCVLGLVHIHIQASNELTLNSVSWTGSVLVLWSHDIFEWMEILVKYFLSSHLICIPCAYFDIKENSNTLTIILEAFESFSFLWPRSWAS